MAEDGGASYGKGDVALAFGLVIGAGLCTVLGALLVFCSDLKDTRLLGGALGVSAGVMIYVSFVEIFSAKAVGGFEDAGYTGAESRRYATIFFFVGMLVIFVLDLLVHCLGFKHHSVKEFPTSNGDAQKKDPAAPAAEGDDETRCTGSRHAVSTEEISQLELTVEDGMERGQGPPPAAPADGAGEDADEAKKKELEKMGLLTAIAIAIHNFPEGMATFVATLADPSVGVAIAIAIHNFPEGMATFVATLADPSVGVAIAIAIAIHNVPEGLCVAMPIYYAKGSKWQGLLWAALSGISEPIGGLIAWLALQGSDMSPLAYGIMFALVGGMMVSLPQTAEVFASLAAAEPHIRAIVGRWPAPLLLTPTAGLHLVRRAHSHGPGVRPEEQRRHLQHGGGHGGHGAEPPALRDLKSAGAAPGRWGRIRVLGAPQSEGGRSARRFTSIHRFITPL